MTRTVRLTADRVAEDPTAPGGARIVSLAYVTDDGAGGLVVLTDLIAAARLGPGYPTDEVILEVPFDLEAWRALHLATAELEALAGYADAPLERMATNWPAELYRYRIDNRYRPPAPAPNRRAPLTTAAATAFAATWAALADNPALAGIIVLLGLAAAIVVDLLVNRP